MTFVKDLQMGLLQISNLSLFFKNFVTLPLSKLLNNTFSCVVFVVYSLFNIFFDVNMSESPKKRKRNLNDCNNTVVHRGLINANWQKLLSNNLVMNNKTDKPELNPNKEHYTGSFRRARKNKIQTESRNVENNLKNLNIQNKPNGTHESKSNNDIILNNDGNSDEKHSANDKKELNKLTRFIAIDCEMVGIGYNGEDHMLARVSLVNKFGDCIYDKFVKPREEVKDYRTEVSGVRKEDLMTGEEFVKVQKDVADILKGKVLVGHSVKHDLGVLFLSHPKRYIRDTSKYKPFRKITKGSTPSLKRLAKEILNIDIQRGEHSSVEDAKATMQLYCTVSKNWEMILKQKRGYSQKIIET